MNYTQSVNYVHSRLKFGIKPGLERIEKLCALLDNPQKNLKIIHVAGTNGKGSVCSMLASICSHTGFKTGLFVSPYVVDFRERISVNGEYIKEEEFAEIITKIEPLASEIEDITEFEILTAAAFEYYRMRQCDVVVLEVGLGGRFDSTNIISSPICSVICNIDYDHMQILGDTISQIANEKCGIIKEKCPVVSYPLQNTDALAVIMEHSARKDCKLYIPDFNNIEILNRSIYGTEFSFGGAKFTVPFPGEHQIANALTAIQVAKILGFTDEFIAAGIKKAFMPARTQVVCDSPLIMVDGCHNENGVSALSALVKQFLSDKKITVIMGMLADKSVEAAASLLIPLCSKVYCVTPNNPRALSAEQFENIALKYCGNTKSFANVFEACATAYNNCNNDEAIICCGSLYLAGEFLSSFEQILNMH